MGRQWGGGTLPGGCCKRQGVVRVLCERGCYVGGPAEKKKKTTVRKTPKKARYLACRRHGCCAGRVTAHRGATTESRALSTGSPKKVRRKKTGKKTKSNSKGCRVEKKGRNTKKSGGKVEVRNARTEQAQAMGVQKNVAGMAQNRNRERRLLTQCQGGPRWVVRRGKKDAQNVGEGGKTGPHKPQQGVGFFFWGVKKKLKKKRQPSPLQEQKTVATKPTVKGSQGSKFTPEKENKKGKGTNRL